jgi:hypothetical protein
METKSTFRWGQAFAGLMMLLLGMLSLWKGRLGMLYHIPIYGRGGSWMYPWQAIVGGSLCLAMGFYCIGTAIQKARKRGKAASEH